MSFIPEPDKCIHELSVGQCGHCNNLDKPKLYWHARYSGDCARCGMPFHAGDLVRWDDDDIHILCRRH